MGQGQARRARTGHSPRSSQPDFLPALPRRYESYDAFEVRLAQGRARRARSLAQLRKHLHAPNGTALRYGLVGFYRAGDEAALKEGLKFPYPFAGWSLGREGSGFWCELH